MVWQSGIRKSSFSGNVFSPLLSGCDISEYKTGFSVSTEEGTFYVKKPSAKIARTANTTLLSRRIENIISDYSVVYSKAININSINQTGYENQLEYKVLPVWSELTSKQTSFLTVMYIMKTNCKNNYRFFSIRPSDEFIKTYYSRINCKGNKLKQDVINFIMSRLKRNFNTRLGYNPKIFMVVEWDEKGSCVNDKVSMRRFHLHGLICTEGTDIETIDKVVKNTLCKGYDSNKLKFATRYKEPDDNYRKLGNYILKSNNRKEVSRRLSSALQQEVKQFYEDVTAKESKLVELNNDGKATTKTKNEWVVLYEQVDAEFLEEQLHQKIYYNVFKPISVAYYKANEKLSAYKNAKTDSMFKQSIELETLLEYRDAKQNYKSLLNRGKYYKSYFEGLLLKYDNEYTSCLSTLNNPSLDDSEADTSSFTDCFIQLY